MAEKHTKGPTLIYSEGNSCCLCCWVEWDTFGILLLHIPNTPNICVCN